MDSGERDTIMAGVFFLGNWRGHLFGVTFLKLPTGMVDRVARFIDIGGPCSHGLSWEPDAELANVSETSQFRNISGALGGSYFRGDRLLSGCPCCHFGLALDGKQFDIESNHGHTLYPAHRARILDHECGKGIAFVEFVDDDPSIAGLRALGGKPECRNDGLRQWGGG